MKLMSANGESERTPVLGVRQSSAALNGGRDFGRTVGMSDELGTFLRSNGSAQPACHLRPPFKAAEDCRTPKTGVFSETFLMGSQRNRTGLDQ
jgi:hypothetical protein